MEHFGGGEFADQLALIVHHRQLVAVVAAEHIQSGGKLVVRLQRGDLADQHILRGQGAPDLHVRQTQNVEEFPRIRRRTERLPVLAGAEKPDQRGKRLQIEIAGFGGDQRHDHQLALFGIDALQLDRLGQKTDDDIQIIDLLGTHMRQRNPLIRNFKGVFALDHAGNQPVGIDLKLESIFGPTQHIRVNPGTADPFDIGEYELFIQNGNQLHITDLSFKYFPPRPATPHSRTVKRQFLTSVRPRPSRSRSSRLPSHFPSSARNRR